MLVAIKHKISKCLIMATLLASTAIAAQAPQSRADVPSQTDYDWQAGLLIRFSLDIEWPQTVLNGDLKTVNFCIMGNAQNFVKSLESYSERAEKKKLKIVVKSNVPNDGFGGCNIAYIPRGNADYREIIKLANKYPVLTVSPIESFAASGGVIEFVRVDVGENTLNNKVNIKFRINNKAAIENKLKIGTEILKTALEVIE